MIAFCQENRRTMRPNIFFRVLPLAAFLCLAACAGSKGATNANSSASEAEAVAAAQPQTPVEQLYRDAASLMDKEQYVSAARKFDEVEQQYPYSQWASKAQVMSAYAHYKNLKYDEAILALDRYIQLHPGEENTAYAWYLRALCYYEQISDVRRDQKMTELALDNLTQVVDRFPDTDYAKDAALKLDLTLDHLAGKEMEIGRYYQERGNYHAAINRFQKVASDYQTTTQVPEALHRLTESWLALGVLPEAQKAAAILGHNYPQSQWYEDSYMLLTGKKPPSAGPASLYDKTLGKIIN